jgi:hypothetical protein
LTYPEYDAATSAPVKTIVDVDTTQTGNFTGLPSGWSTPTGGGLHLVTTMEVDDLGRTTKLTGEEKGAGWIASFSLEAGHRCVDNDE